MIWKRRAKVTKTDVGTFKRYEAKDAPYAVIQCISKWPDHLASRWLAVQTSPYEMVISRHRVKRRAEESCENHASRSS